VTLLLRGDDGTEIDLDDARWHGEPTPAEHRLLDAVPGPVLDVGCGPGRHVLALARRRVLALGIDASPAAVRLARGKGAPVLERSVFGRVPGAGRWRASLLLDGNVGIGGDPVALLRRIRALLRPGGLVVAELDPDEAGLRHLRVRLVADGARGPWFPWAVVGPGRVDEVAAAAGFAVENVVDDESRVFAWLRRA
jgi:SAM-dependent methyltransferase